MAPSSETMPKRILIESTFPSSTPETHRQKTTMKKKSWSTGTQVQQGSLTRQTTRTRSIPQEWQDDAQCSCKWPSTSENV